MKAIQYTAYGDSSIIQVANIEKPAPKAGEVLIKIKATTVNPFDIKLRNGFFQKMMPVQMPFVPGLDAAGVVEAIGPGVIRLAVGDEVFAISKSGSYAEYLAVDETTVAKKPSGINFSEAASLAIPITTAYSVLIDAAHLQAGQKLLIHGASGGVGTIMLQMAKAIGAHVTGTATGEGLALITSLGADEAIDYKTQDFVELVKDADVVVDMVGGETLARSYGIVKQGGFLLSTVMPVDEAKAAKANIKAVFISSRANYKQLEYGAALVEQRKIKPKVSKLMKLEEAAAAQDLVTGGGVNGKIVLTVD